MKWYSNGINTLELLLINDEFDPVDTYILRYLIDFINTGNMDAHLFGVDKYYWICYQSLLDNLPLLKVKTTRSIRSRFEKYIECGLMEHKTSHKRIVKNKIIRGTFSFYRFTEKVQKIVNQGYEEEMRIKEKQVIKIKNGDLTEKMNNKKILSEENNFLPSRKKISYPPGKKFPTKDETIKDETINNEVVYNSDELNKTTNLINKEQAEENSIPASKLKDYTLKAARMLKKYFPVRIPKPEQAATKTLLKLEEYLTQLKNESFQSYNSIDWQWAREFNIQYPHSWFNSTDKIIESMEFAAKRYQELKKEGIWPENKKYLTENIAMWMYNKQAEKSWFLYCVNNEPRKVEDIKTKIDRIKNTIFPDTDNGRIEKKAAEKFRLPAWDEEKYWQNVSEIYDWWKVRDEVIKEANEYRQGGIDGLDELLDRMKQFRDTWDQSKPWNLGNFYLKSKTWRLFEEWMEKELNYPINYTTEYLYKIALSIKKIKNRKVKYFDFLEEEALKDRERKEDEKNKRIEMAMNEMVKEAEGMLV